MLDLIRSITKKEWLLVFGLSFLVIVITTLPLVYGWLISPDNSVFTGIHFYNLNDWIVYYSYLEQIKDGNFLFRDLFTSESAALVFNPFWLAAGLIGRVFKLSNIVTLNLARILLIPIFYFVAFASFFFFGPGFFAFFSDYALSE